MPKEPTLYLTFADREAWRAWLEAHAATAREAWLVHYKKKAARQGLSYEEGVEEALCFGWIDGVLRRIDDERYALRYSPRKRGSLWAENNKRRVARLTKEGRMSAAGLEKVAEAKASGEWEAATAREDVSRIPRDLARALREHRGAWASFERWPASRKKMQLYWLASARKAETRQKRIQAIVAMAGGGE